MALLPFASAALLCALATVHVRPGPVRSAREARAIAEQETSGLAVSTRKVHLNGASCGWEVVLHMPGEARGWRCIVDCDTRSVFTRTRIPNPPPPRRRP